MAVKVITSVHMLIEKVMEDYSAWDTSTFPWFRGEARDVKVPLRPRLFRIKDRDEQTENRLLQHFRMKAPTLGLDYVPPREYTDQWLFLAQHVLLPTRLLDWSGGLLISLHFALYTKKKGAVVWMLDPIRLNRETDSNASENDFALTWYSPLKRPLIAEDLILINRFHRGKYDDGGVMKMAGLSGNIGNENIRKAWEPGHKGTDFPVAVHPTNIHPRMSSQVSRFTIHGEDERGLSQMNLERRILRKYVIGMRAIESIKEELRMMGITHSSLFPELDGLAKELAQIN